MPLNYYRSDADTGSALSSSVQPFGNGERGNATTLTRPPANLLYRTEDVRQVSDVRELLSRSDRGLVIGASGALDAKVLVVGNGSDGYYFRLNTAGTDTVSNRDLLLFPLVSVATVSSSLPKLAQYVYDDSQGGKFSLTPDDSRRVCQGSHQILFRVFTVVGSNASPAIFIEGAADPSNPDPTEGPVTIAAQVANNGSSTIQQLVNAINTHPAASHLVTAAIPSGGDGNRPAPTALDPIRFYEGGSSCVGGVDDEAFRIPGSQIDSFFATPKRILEGGFLVLDFYRAVQRLQTSLTDDASVVLRVINPGEPGDTRNTADCVGTVPLCKALSGALHFAHGRSFLAGRADLLLDSLVEEAALRSDLAKKAGSPYGDYQIGAVGRSSAHLPLAVGTIGSQLSNLALLGSEDPSKGGSLLGSEALTVSPFPTFSAGTLRSQMSTLLNTLTGSSGAAKIGKAAVSPRLTGNGYLSDKISKLLALLVDHTQGSPLQDQHTFVACKRSSVIVAASGGDYTTIGAALTALKSTGGTIWIKEGTYAESVSWASGTVSYPIDVFGLGNVIWRPEAEANLPQFAITCLLQSTVSFKNIHFQNLSGDHNYQAAIDLNETTLSTFRGGLTFENCRFSMPDTDGRLAISFVHNGSLEVSDCSFACDNNPGATSGTIAALGDCHVSIHDSKFYKVGAALKIVGPTASNFTGCVDVFRNEFWQCEFQEGADALISVLGGKIIRITENSHPQYSHIYYNRFCQVRSADHVYIDGNYAINSLGVQVGASGDTSMVSWVTNNVVHYVPSVSTPQDLIRVSGGVHTLVQQNRCYNNYLFSTALEGSDLQTAFVTDNSHSLFWLEPQSSLNWTLLARNRALGSFYENSSFVEVSASAACMRVVLIDNIFSYSHSGTEAGPTVCWMGTRPATLLRNKMGGTLYGVKGTGSDIIFASNQVSGRNTTSAELLVSLPAESICARNYLLQVNSSLLGSAVKLDQTPDSIVLDNQIASGSYGVLVDSQCTRAIIAGNEINCNQIGIQLEAKASPADIHAIIYGNLLYTPTSESCMNPALYCKLTLGDLQDVLFAKNLISGSGVGFLAGVGRDGVLTNDHKLLQSVVSGNLIFRNSINFENMQGIGISPGTSDADIHVVVSGNLISTPYDDSHEWGYGIFLPKAHKVALYQNSIQGFYGGWLQSILAEATRVGVSQNLTDSNFQTYNLYFFP